MSAVAAVAARSVTITPSGKALGADVAGLDLTRPLAASEIEAVRKAWAEHLVLRFRGHRGLSLEQLAAFSRYLGELDRAPIKSDPTGKVSPDEHPEITVMSNMIVDGKAIGRLG